jgi:hypothetical protein
MASDRLGASAGPITLGGASGPVPFFACGTGGLSIVGEKGPELLNIPRGSQVIPNDVLRSGVGGDSVNVQGGNVIIQGDASEKTVALIKAAIAQQNAELPTRVVAAVRKAKTTRAL